MDLSLGSTSVHGRVTAESGDAVAMATVRMKGSPESTFTDADGNYRLHGVETSKRERAVEATAPGFERGSKAVAVTRPGEEHRADISLRRAGSGTH